MRRNKKLHLIISFLSLFLLIFNLYFISAEEIKGNVIKIRNSSDLSRTLTPVEITLPSYYNQIENIKLINKKDSTELPIKVFENANGPVLITQLDISGEEELEIILEKGTPKSTYLFPTPSYGTDYAFVNFKKAIIISSSDENNIKVSTKEAKLIDEFKLNKGKEKIIEYDTPQFLLISAEKPIFVYCSSLSDHSKVGSLEPGDSDTTTLYGNDLYIYTEKHLWLSTYEETNVKIYDRNDIEVYSKSFGKNSSLFLDDMTAGIYHIIADEPITVQFGYLDDENFSFIYGKQNNINGFAFGDLMFISKYPETNIDLVLNGKKRTIRLKEANQFEIVSAITEFSQKVPESVFFTSTSNKPILILTFSSGNNFGGEFVPGDNCLFLDNSFSLITGRISKEFSKEQKNIISLLSVGNEASVEVDGAIKSKAILGDYTDYYLESNVSNGIINIKSDKRILVSHLHNYRDKGLFYFVPPVKDNSLYLSLVVDPSNNSISNIISNNGNVELFSLNRIKDFFVNVFSKDNLLFTIIFLILILLIVLGIIILINASRKLKLEIKPKEEIRKSEINIIREAEKELEEPIVIETEKEMPPSPEIKEEEIPHLLIKRIEEKEEIVEKKEPSKEEILRRKETERFFELNIPVRRSIFEEIKDKKIVLDPGSANRLYVENLLSEFSFPYICEESTKRLSQEVVKLLKVFNLSKRNLEQAKLLSLRLSIVEEAGKALILAKSINAYVYITSYKLPKKVYKIVIITISDLLKDL